MLGKPVMTKVEEMLNFLLIFCKRFDIIMSVLPHNCIDL